ncbi:MAG: DUF1207 domain-containing protein [Parachlamydiaceae bacterium]|nr:DUF1207 domain-containing protein [Parachlamydiaceae bacterium]
MQARYKLSLVFLNFLLGFSAIGNAGYEGTFPIAPEAPIETITDASDSRRTGVWLPEDPLLFKPFVANPRKVDYSVGWRLNDNMLVKNVIDVSFGDIITFYRWINVGPWKGQLEFGLEGALWAVFDPLHYSSPLMNADYYVGIPISYAFGPWSFRLRGYHISSHIGDEYLLDHPRFKRKNPSAEYIDFFASYYPTDEIRLYGGVGFVVGMDESFRIGRLYAEAGAELHMSQLGFVDVCDQIYGRPFYGMHFHYQTEHTNHVNQTYVLGYEWGKLCGLQRIFRAFIEYHDGYSVEGQFYRKHTNYFSVRLSYGF